MGNGALNKIDQVCMEIWNSKSGGNMYPDFKVKFEALPKVYFGHVIYHFEAQEVTNPTLQTVCESELKRGNYTHLEKIGQGRKLSSKLTTWVRNGFLPFKIQRNTRKLLAKVKFESLYLFRTRGMYFKSKSMKFLHRQWVSSKFPVNGFVLPTCQRTKLPSLIFLLDVLQAFSYN